MSITLSGRPTSQRTSNYNPRQTKTSIGQKERTYYITYDSSSGEENQRENYSNIEHYNLRQKNVRVIQGTRYKTTAEISKDQLSHSQNKIDKTIYSNYTPERLDNNLTEGVFFKGNYSPIDYSKMRIFANQNRNYAKFYFPMKDLSSIEKEIIQDAPINWLLGKPDEFYYRSRTPYPKFEYQYQPGVKVMRKHYYNQPKRYYYLEEQKNNFERPGRFAYESKLDKAATLISSHWRGHRYRIELNDYRRKFDNNINRFDNAYYERSIPRNYNYKYNDKRNYDDKYDDSFRKSYNFKNKHIYEKNEYYRKNATPRNDYKNINNSNDIIKKYRNMINNENNEYKSTNNSNEINEKYKTIISNDSIDNNEKYRVLQKPKEYNDYRNINNSHEIIEKYRTIISEEPNLNSSNEKYENVMNINISSNDKIEDKKRKSKPNEKIDNLKKYNIRKENIPINENLRKTGNYKNIITKERVDNKGNVVKETTTKSFITNSKNKDKSSSYNDEYYEEETEEKITKKKPIYNIEKTKIKNISKDNNQNTIVTEDIEVRINEEEIESKKIIKNIKPVNKNTNDNMKEIAAKKLANTLNKKVKEEENILIDNLNKNRTGKRIEDAFNKVSNYMRKSSNKEVFDKINEKKEYDDNEIKLKGTPNVLNKDTNIKFKSKPNVLKKIDIEEEIIPVISGEMNEIKEDEKIILKGDLNKNEKNVNNINNRKEGFNKLQNVMDNVNKNKGMQSLKTNQKNEKVKENINKLNNMIIEKEKQIGINALKENKENEEKKEKLTNLNKVIVEKEKKTVITTLKQNKDDEIKKEKLGNIDKILSDKNKQKGINVLKKK